MGGRGAWRIGGYVADELIGYGASAQVWRGHVGRGGEAVALKVLDLSDAAAVRAAKAEAAVLSALDHPHLIRLRELVPDGESVVLVLELAAGGSLADLLARRGRLSPGEVVVALSPIAAALAYAHDAGVVHCDVSPANVLFRGDGSPLLADLGVARLVGGFDAPRSTLAYIDPGVAAGGVPSDASDVFMVAATAFHALTGTPPWTGASAEAILDQAADAEIPDLERRLVGVPAAVAEVVRRGLDPSPAARGSAAEFALDLRHAAAPVPVDLDVGPSASRREVGSGAPVSYATSSDVDAGGPGIDVSATDSASRRAEARTRVTSTVAGRADGPVAVCASDPARVTGDGASDGARGRGANDGPGGRATTSRARASEPGQAHVARHAALPPAAGSPSVAEAIYRPPPVVLERPDFIRPGDTRDRRAVERGPDVGVAASGASAADPVLRSSPAQAPSDVGRRDDHRPGERLARAARAPRAARAATVDGVAASEPPLALTHIVRARIRPPDHEPSGRRLAGMPHWTRNAAAAAAVVLLVAGGALATWLRWASTGTTASSASNGATGSARVTITTATTASAPSAGSTTSSDRASPTLTKAPTSRPVPTAQATPGTSPSSTAAPGSSPSTHARTPALPSSASAPPSRTPQSAPRISTPAWPRSNGEWAALLSALDHRRQKAFATDDPVPLADVYVDGILLDQDRRTLAQVVQPGCRLLGLRTSYRNVHVSSVAPERSVLTTQASLSASRLQCPHQPTRVVSAHAPVAMTLVLAPTGGHILIAGISMVT